jgi:predicted small lipoprotein YifL
MGGCVDIAVIPSFPIFTLDCQVHMRPKFFLKAILAALLGAAVLAACGQKGPLRLPGEPPKTPPAETPAGEKK